MKKVKKICTCCLTIFGVILILSSSCKKKNSDNPATVTDQDGNSYNTVIIGTQVWMAENLRVTKYRNGDPIPKITDSLQWMNLGTGAYCTNNTIGQEAAAYGLLYNWYAATDSRNIAPSGWHVPSHTEWAALINYLGGAEVAGGKVREKGTTHWRAPNTGATNESGFTALPGGGRGEFGTFLEIGSEAVWWSTSKESETDFYALSAFTLYLAPSMREAHGLKIEGCSIRCIKD
jgi:uncharacterized protein (TIGR02145 family)